MAKNSKKKPCGTLGADEMGCCKVESVISIDERGQMVLPLKIRDRANIRAGDRIAIVSWEKRGKVCCVSLIKADDLAEMVKNLLGPMMKEVLHK
jgi:antitoxin PrlF